MRQLKPSNIQSWKNKLQAGSVLLEALISILIFSMGILAVVGLQAASVKASTDAKYRTEASFFANQLIGQMWVADRAPATLKANFEGSGGNGGAKYIEWAGNPSSTTAGTVTGDLPGASSNPPVVTVTTLTNTHSSSIVSITIFWRLPGENVTHNYTTTAQIS